jgi:hypothetical protein
MSLDREPDPDPWEESRLLRLEIRNLRLENQYYREQIQAAAAPKYFSGRWVRQPGTHQQPQISRK